MSPDSSLRPALIPPADDTPCNCQVNELLLSDVTWQMRLHSSQQRVGCVTMEMTWLPWGLSHLVGSRSFLAGWRGGSRRWTPFAGGRWRSSRAPLGPAAQTARGRGQKDKWSCYNHRGELQTYLNLYTQSVAPQNCCYCQHWTPGNYLPLVQNTPPNPPKHSHLALSRWNKKQQNPAHSRRINCFILSNQQKPETPQAGF